jgi:putative ABC transport system permease protein
VVVSSIDEIEIGLSFNWARVGLIFAVGVMVGILASLLPSRRATRLDMLEAMRSE